MLRRNIAAVAAFRPSNLTDLHIAKSQPILSHADKG